MLRTLIIVVLVLVTALAVLFFTGPRVATDTTISFLLGSLCFVWRLSHISDNHREKHKLRC